MVCSGNSIALGQHSFTETIRVKNSNKGKEPDKKNPQLLPADAFCQSIWSLCVLSYPPTKKKWKYISLKITVGHGIISNKGTKKI